LIPDIKHYGIFLELGHIGLFISAFFSCNDFAAKLRNFLSALLLNGLSPNTLVIIATLGKVLGSLTNYALGYWASLVVVKKWLRMSEDDFVRAEQCFVKYGMFVLCFAWVPIIGDPLTVMAGVFRVRLRWFLILVTSGKFMRYVVISYMVLKVN
jgi:membrane protein YqaA with SNARE-associated domain